MKFHCAPENFEEMQEPSSGLEDIVELEVTIYEKDPFVQEMPDQYILFDDYLGKELERQELENPP